MYIVVLILLASSSLLSSGDGKNSNSYRTKVAHRASQRLYRDGNIYAPIVPLALNTPLTEEHALNTRWQLLRTAPQAQKDAELRRVLKAWWSIFNDQGNGFSYSNFGTLRRHLAAAALIGANLEMTDLEGRTALWGAVVHLDTQLVALLLAHGAHHNRDILASAVRKGATGLAELLLQYGADPKAPRARPENNNENLLWSIRSYTDGRAMANLLIQHGASIQTRSAYHGDSLLHATCQYGADTMVRFWRSQGLSPLIQNNAGDTPLNALAHNYHHSDAEICRTFDALLEGLSPQEIIHLFAMRRVGFRESTPLIRQRAMDCLATAHRQSGQ